MTCFECDPVLGDNLWHCHDASVLHDDGTTECLSGAPCELPHDLHEFQLRCAEIEPGCPCTGVVGAVTAFAATAA